MTSIDGRPDDLNVPDYDPEAGSIEEILGEDSREKDDKEKVPVPYIAGLSNDGIVTLRFSTPMEVPDDVKEVSSAKVALRKL